MLSFDKLTMKSVTISEIDDLVTLVCELAHDERVEPADKGYLKDSLITHGFLEHPKFHAKFAMINNEIIGYIIYSFRFLPSKGRPVLFLEDLYVRSSYRRKRVATAFFRELAQIANHENCCSINWVVFKWNSSAIQFYKTLGSDLVDTLDQYTLTETKYLTFID